MFRLQMEHNHKFHKLKEELKEEQFELLSQELNEQKKAREMEILTKFNSSLNPKEKIPNRNHLKMPKRILKPPPVSVAAVEQKVPVCPIPEKPFSFLEKFIKEQKIL